MPAESESPLPLAGRGIVVTRPRAQAEVLARRVHAAGGVPILFPLLEILEPDAAALASLDVVIERIDRYDLAIFVSPNAVAGAMQRIADTCRLPLPPRLRIAAVGPGSARELARFGVGDVIVPQQRFDSEALLALPQLADIAGQRIVIFRGNGGRPLLGDTLVARGAVVEYAECYRRVVPQLDAAPLLDAWKHHRIDAITITSSEGLRNLFDGVGESGRLLLQETPLIATHRRIADAARALGAVAVAIAGPDDEALVAGLIAYFAQPAQQR
ncbi:MAG TPA: uroporphyrinogen-III synthase [Burkholderiales bacterium]|nr:uroporphyrinogen-III synthase [Burkholderiales bacterium]